MATLHVKDDTFYRLAQQAAARNTSVEEYVEPVLDRLADTASASAPNSLLTAAEREQALREWMTLVQKRSVRYPAEFVADDTRESIYEGRGE